ncbi:unnamed protein product [Rhizophagus irregularis]|uniref:Uncharacterized protein n=1 Tax=Rhizophagus irregularis TaxID=588596 RepID=A0A916E3A6_9GLOM|nr:unnamed protein product [Rhizophagus irregularis]CAB5355006.1 unnamed protein product [Rhizophagus irregularis]
MTRLVFTQSGYSMTIVKNCPGLSYLPEPVNYHPGYDMDYVHAYIYNEIIEMEKEDALLVVKPGQTLTSWAINVRIRFGQAEA